MNSKGQRGNCTYNWQWELNSQYKGWLTTLKADRKKALCKWWDRVIDILNMGESALKLHMKSERHKNNSRIGGEQAVTLSSFGFDLASLDKKIKFLAGKAEGIILYNPIFWLYDIFTHRNCFFLD